MLFYHNFAPFKHEGPITGNIIVMDNYISHLCHLPNIVCHPLCEDKVFFFLFSLYFLTDIALACFQGLSEIEQTQCSFFFLHTLGPLTFPFCPSTVFTHYCQPFRRCRTQTLHFSFLNADKHRHWMPSLVRSAYEAAQGEGHSDDDEESADYSGHVLALNGHKKYFCLFRPVFTGDDSSSEASSSSSSRRKSRSRSRSSSHSRSRSHSREDGAVPKKSSSRATSIEVHHKLDRLGLWMERLMEGTLPRLRVPAWPSLSTES